MKLLIVEDEAKTARYVRAGLIEHDFVVDVASNGVDGLHLLASGAYDLAVVDVMLPGLDGWTLVSRLRAGGKKTPVLFLTAKDAVEDRVRGLDIGGDDYLVKPFAFSELLARVRSLLRRPSVTGPEILRIADLEVDPVRHVVTRAGGRVDLTPKEFLLLSLLARRAGEVLSRTIIAEQVWDMNFSCDTNVVDVHVRRLRRKMDDPYPVKLVHTVRGSGYVLEHRGE